MTEAGRGPREWTLSPYQPGDEREILQLFNAGFGQNCSLTHWNWKYQSNPCGGPFASLARRISDRTMVGSYMCLPFKLNLEGSPVLAAQTVDLVVHPDYRRQGMFEQMAINSYELLAGLGARAVVAFPNPTAMSYPGFTRTLGWKPLCWPRRFTARLDLEQPLQKLLRLPWLARALNSGFRVAHAARLERNCQRLESSSSAPMEFILTNEVPPGCDRLWKACLVHSGLSFWKDSDYFRWRYDRNPDHHFEYGSLTRGGELIALAVAVERDRAITLCELLVAERDVHAGRRLISELCRLYFTKRMKSLSFFGHDAGFYTQALAGFSISRVSENVLVGRALNDDTLEALMSEPDRWTLAYGDADFV